MFRCATSHAVWWAPATGGCGGSFGVADVNCSMTWVVETIVVQQQVVGHQGIGSEFQRRSRVGVEDEGDEAGEEAELGRDRLKRSAA